MLTRILDRDLVKIFFSGKLVSKITNTVILLREAMLGDNAFTSNGAEKMLLRF
jgi:hypothetical protein